MSISKKVRFNVFKRDMFKCSYCGATPPSVVLEVDHVIPKSKGGSDNINNLTTSCFACNRGKTNESLNVAPLTIEEKRIILAEKQEQLKIYYRLIKKIEKQEEDDLYEIGNHFFEYFGKENYVFANNWLLTIKSFLKNFTVYEIKDAIDRSYLRISRHGRKSEKDTFRYMCGILHNKIRENKAGVL